MGLAIWVRRGKTTARQVVRAGYSFFGLMGILSAFFLFIGVSSSFVSGTDFDLLVSMMNFTVFKFLTTAVAMVLFLRLLFGLKRLIWWVWATQTPDFAPPQESRKNPTENLVNTAIRKGKFWSTIGLITGYLLPLFGIYADPISMTFMRDYPEMPLLEEIVGVVSQLPIISDIGFIASLLSIIHPVEYIFLFFTLAPLTLGLWNLSYVFKHNRFFRGHVFDQFVRTETAYLISIGLGTVGTIFTAYVLSS